MVHTKGKHEIWTKTCKTLAGPTFERYSASVLFCKDKIDAAGQLQSQRVR